jgi:ribosome-interacting GTPase 1
MQEFLSLVPQHKGTLKLRGQIKKKMAIMRRELEEKKQKRAGRSGPKFFIEKEGAAQVALLGVTKSGKSCLLSAVTNAKIEVSPSPSSSPVSEQSFPALYVYALATVVVVAVVGVSVFSVLWRRRLKREQGQTRP